MHYFKWSGVLAIRTMQCIQMLFLYDTLHLYYTPDGLLAWLLILLPYIDLVCWLAPLTAILIATQVIELMYTAATLSDWIVFHFLLCFSHACFLFHFLFEFNLESLSFTQQSVLMHLFMQLIACIATFPHSSKASSSVPDLCTLSWLVQHCLGWHSHLASYIP